MSLRVFSKRNVFRSTNESESIEVVREALRQGINYIDVAPWYGHGLAEKVLGKVYYINVKYLQRERKCRTRVFFFSMEFYVRQICMR